MIKRIDQVKNYRIFQNWQPETAIPDFCKVNLIYGVNGSGKSSLASLIADASNDLNWTSGLSLSVQRTDGSTDEVKNFDDQFWNNVRVFNRKFIEENLKFDSGEKSLAIALLQIGKVNIDRDEELKTRETKKIEFEKELPLKNGALTQIIARQDKLARDTADVIGSELLAIGGRYRSRSYTALQVKQLLAHPLQGVDSSKISQNLEIINSPRFSTLVIPDQMFFSTQVLSARIREICNRSAISVVIEALEQDPSLASWVQLGLKLHQASDSCFFCGNTLSSARKEHLNQHFSESFKKLQSDIDAEVSAIQILRVNLTRIKNLIPQSSQLLPEFRMDFRVELESVEKKISDFFERLAELDKILERKRIKLFESIHLTSIAEPDVTIDLKELIEIIRRHNGQVPMVENSLLDRAKEVECTRVLAIQEEYSSNDKDIGTLEAEILELKSESNKNDERLAYLKSEGGDPISLAEELNIELAEILGRDELVFKFISDGQYSIDRNGAPATLLSEGEKSVISLLYFVKSLDAANCDRSNTVVIFDDPISSMDSNFTIGIFSRIWASLVGQEGGNDKCRQLFLLSHNFEFFRSWCNSLDRIGDTQRSRQGITYLILELRTKIKSSGPGTTLREPYFLQWPLDDRLKRRIKSEYHYLFWRVAEALRKCKEEPSIENDLEAAAILPNSCRRLLEGFLSFRFPTDIGNLRGQLSSAIDLVRDTAVRTRLLTFLHQYSHNEEPDTSRPIDRPESVRILNSVFELIKVVDEQHYKEMIKALDVEDSI